ncbi:MAG: [citrate (pro-3S)-lyase] ligase [Sulfurospirillum sp.]
MDSSISFSEFDFTNSRRVKRVEKFLNAMGLDFPNSIENFVIAKDGNKLIACGGLDGKVLKGIAVAPHRRGEGLILSIMTRLINISYTKGIKVLFIFSTPNNMELFEGCGFKLIENCDNEIMLMENSDNLEIYKNKLASSARDGNVIGSIVMNANPFTLGHQYLVEEAAKKSDWLHLFVVKEDLSEFKFVDRIKLIKKGVSYIPNVTVHEGSDYIISNATFPTYFIKDKGKINELHAKLDLSVFRNHLAPVLGITHRFVGTEPYCVVTNNYNKNMKKILENPNGKSNSIEVVEIQRIEKNGKAISASRVRDLLRVKKFDELKKIVPASTLEFLEKM